MTKRANGEGSTFRRKDKRRTVYGKTQTEVRAKLKSARQRLEAGAPIKDATMTLGIWVEEWIGKALEASDRRKRATKDLYAGNARTHLVPLLGTVTLERLRPSDVEAPMVRSEKPACHPQRSGPSAACCVPPSTSRSATAWCSATPH